MKEAGFTTCKSHTHFYSQSCHETTGFISFAETPYYSVERFYTSYYFDQNCNTKIMYNQDFWDNKTYKNYFAGKGDGWFETSTDLQATNKYLPVEGNSNTYHWTSYKQTRSAFSSCKDVVKEEGDTIRLAYSFKKATTIPENTTFYVPYSLTNTQREECCKKLLSLLYATYTGNGDASTEDGYKYRGRGLVHLTGKAKYKAVSDKCNSFFETNFDFETDYKKVTSDHAYVIYSGVAYYLYVGAVSKLHTSNCKTASYIVNGGYNGYDDENHTDYTRLSLFKKYRDEIFYDCNIVENE